MIAPDTLADLLSVIHLTEQASALGARIKDIEGTHKGVELLIRLSLDFPTWSWGASVSVTAPPPTERRKRMEFHGGTTSDGLVTTIAAWAGDGRMDAFLKEQEPYEIQQAKEIYAAAASLSHDCDNTVFDETPPPAVVEWLNARKAQAVPREAMKRLYKAQLQASWSWANRLQ